MRVLLAPSADLARHVLETENVALTVEAEYGSFVAEGRVFTAAHHQPYGAKYAGRHLDPDGRPSPCNDRKIPPVGVDEVVLVSHLDLDTFGGVLRAMPEFRDLFGPVIVGIDVDPAEFQEMTAQRWGRLYFWDFAEFVDVNGPHKLAASSIPEKTLRQLHAFWAWSKSPEGGPRLPRDQVSDVTDLVTAAGVALRAILADDEKMLVAGDQHRADEEALNERTFVGRSGDVIVRVAGSREFCNHLYADPSGVPAKAVVSMSRSSGAVTVSLASSVPGVSCRDIVQKLWGPEAGGHEGIAGSPREQYMGFDGLADAVKAMREALER